MIGSNSVSSDLGLCTGVCSQVLGESMDMCFGVLRPVYGFQKFLSNTMQRLESWQAVEAVIFAFTRIARPMISLVKGIFTRSRPDDNALGAFYRLIPSQLHGGAEKPLRIGQPEFRVTCCEVSPQHCVLAGDCGLDLIFGLVRLVFCS